MTGCRRDFTARRERLVSKDTMCVTYADKDLQAKKAVNYAVDVDSEEEDDGGFNPTPGTKPRGRASKRRKTSVESDDDDDDVFVADVVEEDDVVDEGMLHPLCFICLSSPG